MNNIRYPFITIIPAVLLLTSLHVTWASTLDDLTQSEVSAGLKEALLSGATSAVSLLGKQDGFLGNDAVRIPLPENLRKAEKYLRIMGQEKHADELVVSMNRAAEAAVPEAKAMLIDSVKKMTVTDAKSNLTGGDDSTTQFFRRTTSVPLKAKFLPIVKLATDRVGLAQTYNNLASTATKFGLLKEGHESIEAYVTDKALDGLYFMIAEEERKIRRNPVGYGSKLLGKVFGAVL